MFWLAYPDVVYIGSILVLVRVLAFCRSQTSVHQHATVRWDSIRASWPQSTKSGRVRRGGCGDNCTSLDLGSLTREIR